jgi:pteridine reductase
LITGGAKRIGAQIACTLHKANFNLTLHYNNSQLEADTLAEKLNSQKPNSVITCQANLLNHAERENLIKQHLLKWQRLDVLINNASLFYETPLGHSSNQQWQQLMGTNVEAPYFLSELCIEPLRHSQGSIINIVDIYAKYPLKNHSIYSISKAALANMTKSLALELAPDIRVNGISPGNILWPEQFLNDNIKQQKINQIPLQRQGEPADIASTVLFLIEQSYITGQIIRVDGGKGI